MKTFTTLLVLACSFILSNAYATIITVSNNSRIPAQYTSLPEAVEAASSSDTLYIHGSEDYYGNLYGSIDINKKLTLIGTGYKPESNLNLFSKIMTIHLLKGSEGTVFTGLDISVLMVPASTYISDITIHKCKIDQLSVHSTSSSWLVRNNIITNLYFQDGNNIVITNNITRGITFISSQTYTTFNILIANNIIFGSLQTKNTIITNNILVDCSVESTSYSVFNNNINYSKLRDINNYPLKELPFGTNSGSGNLFQIDPLFADITNYESTILTDDYSLQANSPAKNVGTDGTDIGISGGAMPFNLQKAGEPIIPQIRSLEVQNAYVPVNGSLHIKSKAEVKN